MKRNRLRDAVGTKIENKRAPHKRTLALETLEARFYLSADGLFACSAVLDAPVEGTVQEVAASYVELAAPIPIPDDLPSSSSQDDDGAAFSGIAAEHWNSFSDASPLCDHSEETSAAIEACAPISELEIETLDFSAVSNCALAYDDSDFNSDDERDEEEEPTRSGGSSGGSSSVIAANYSGDGIPYPVQNPTQWLLREGTDVVISLQGGQTGDVVTAQIIHGGTCADDFGACCFQAVIGGSGFIHFMIAQDQLFDEADESFTITLSVTSGSSMLTQSTFNFTIMWQPEFISDVDYGATAQTANADSYRTCVRFNAPSGAQLTHRRTPVNVYSASGNMARYSIVTDPNNQNDPSQYFRINPTSGVISLTESGRTIVYNTNGTFHFTLTIKAENARFDGISGGCPFDTAEVDITLSRWIIERDNDSTAEVGPTDGATIEMLAHAVGLNHEEFKKWLTYNVNSNVELYDGSFISCSELEPAYMLAASAVGLFSVPNTIFAAYCFNPVLKNNTVNGYCINWDDNISGFVTLGFKVEQYDNSTYIGATAPTATEKKTQFLSILSDLSNSKSLQGVYIASHGDITGIFIPADPLATNNNNNNGWGPAWSIDYSSGSFSDVNDPNLPDTTWTVAGALNYHLAALIVHACDSGFQTSVLSSHSLDDNTSAIVKTFPGYAYASPFDWGVYWEFHFFEDGLTKGGLQGTNRY